MIYIVLPFVVTLVVARRWEHAWIAFWASSATSFCIWISLNVQPRWHVLDRVPWWGQTLLALTVFAVSVAYHWRRGEAPE